MKSQKIISLILAAAAAGTLSSCGQEKQTSSDGAKLTWWTRLYANVAQTATSFSEIELYKQLAERTGIELEFIHPAVGQETESFNTMMASGELPDIITRDMTTYKGGPDKAISDGVIMVIDDYLDQAVNYSKFLKENPLIEKQLITDSGKHYCFGSFRDTEMGSYWQGLQIRKDLLDKAGLPLPETIDDWTKTLRAFKDMGIEYPLTLTGLFQKGTFCSAFGIGEQFYQDNGVVKYGVLEPEFKEYLNLMRSWYQEGLLDPDFFAHDGKTFDSKITSGKAGAYFAPVGGGMGRYLPVLQSNDPSYDLSGVKFPVMNKGETPKYAVRTPEYNAETSAYITPQCDNIEAAIKLLDYGYSDEGHMLYNFGIEGVSYNMEDGYPKYTDLVLKNPDGLAPAHALAIYTAGVYGGAFASDPRYFEQYQTYEQQKDAVRLWAQQDYTNHMPNVSFTEEETDVLATKQNAVNSFMKEQVLNFLTGKRDMAEYDSFVAELKAMGMDEIIAINQAALERYNKR